MAETLKQKKTCDLSRTVTVIPTNTAPEKLFSRVRSPRCKGYLCRAKSTPPRCLPPNPPASVMIRKRESLPPRHVSPLFLPQTPVCLPASIFPSDLRYHQPDLLGLPGLLQHMNTPSLALTNTGGSSYGSGGQKSKMRLPCPLNKLVSHSKSFLSVTSSVTHFVPPLIL